MICDTKNAAKPISNGTAVIFLFIPNMTTSMMGKNNVKNRPIKKETIVTEGIMLDSIN